jgi:hypothetical protein
VGIAFFFVMGAAVILWARPFSEKVQSTRFSKLPVVRLITSALYSVPFIRILGVVWLGIGFVLLMVTIFD